ncbi:MAG TPA: Mur ligase domain-containing protein [Candidatus Saccharimonadales bacterium]|nr:Mur ligase domain-containing protein [Candidatus Saccharimonadales bacterium]
MHIYFSGVGGTAIGPLALIAHEAGFEVSGSDKRSSLYIEYLKKHGVGTIHIGQTYDQIEAVHAKQPIDWFVYTSALPMEHPDAPELQFCRDRGIKATKRDEFLNFLLQEKKLDMVAVAGTHGKTTTTAMAIWLFKQLGMPISYSVGAKMSFGEMGEFDPASRFFVYEADEFDRNFLAFRPRISLVTGIDWDHPDIYPTRESYNQAFHQFLNQSDQAILWQEDAAILGKKPDAKTSLLADDTAELHSLKLPGLVNRKDALLVAHAVRLLTGRPLDELIGHLNRFPGVARRFERISGDLYSDYAHTPPKIRGALQMAHEVAGDNVIVIYEGLHNTRQHFIKHELRNLFEKVKALYIVPSYLARENASLQLLTPDDLKNLLNDATQAHTQAAALDANLAAVIRNHLAQGDLVLGISAGGGGSLDEWLRKEFATNEPARLVP